MSEVKFPALFGDSPLAVLAAIGTMRLVHDHIDSTAQLSWDPDDRVPVLRSSLEDVDEVVARLRTIIDELPEGALVPGGPVGFPPPGAAPDKLRVAQGELTGLVGSLTAGNTLGEKQTVWAWISSLVTDLAVDSSGRGAIIQFAAPAGKQSMATMLEFPLDCVRKAPDYLRQAFLGWRRVSGVTGEYLDHRANWDSGEDGRGKADMRGVPGATWLALMSYPLWTTTATAHGVRSSGWHTVRQGRRRVQELRLPLWHEFLGPDAVVALVEHPALDREWTMIDRTALRRLGIFHVCRAHRRAAMGAKSAGVLVTLP